MNVAPSDCTSSLTAGRTSYDETTAPRRRAVAMACRPATPAPMTRTRVGATVPAAVIIIGNNLPIRPAAMTTALYPAADACEESASIDRAPDIRGRNSRLDAGNTPPGN